jgi:hypothetical protein
VHAFLGLKILFRDQEFSNSNVTFYVVDFVAKDDFEIAFKKHKKGTYGFHPIL